MSTDGTYALGVYEKDGVQRVAQSVRAAVSLVFEGFTLKEADEPEVDFPEVELDFDDDLLIEPEPFDFDGAVDRAGFLIDSDEDGHPDGPDEPKVPAAPTPSSIFGN